MYKTKSSACAQSHGDRHKINNRFWEHFFDKNWTLRTLKPAFQSNDVISKYSGRENSPRPYQPFFAIKVHQDFAYSKSWTVFNVIAIRCISFWNYLLECVTRHFYDDNTNSLAKSPTQFLAVIAQMRLISSKVSNVVTHRDVFIFSATCYRLLISLSNLQAS